MIAPLLFLVLVLPTFGQLKNIFVIPHSHCDVGYVETYQQYYDNKVKYILNTVVESLSSNQNHTFLWSETAFLEKWIKEFPEKLPLFKKLVHEKRLQLVGGGWVMHDETCSTFYGQSMQMTTGHKYLAQNNLPQPTVSWQIDPFGSSVTTPREMAGFGFSKGVYRRIPWFAWEPLRTSQNLEFFYNYNCGNPNSIYFYHILGMTYSSPIGFDFPHDPPVTPENIEELSQSFLDQISARSKWYRHDAVLVPLGGDFEYTTNVNFVNMDKIMEYLAENYPQYSVRYGTLDDYFDYIFDYATKNNITFDSFCGDFFPYGNEPLGMWSGIFSSRPIIKEKLRDSLKKLQSFQDIVAHLEPTFETVLDNIRQNISVLLHHDSIPGTAKDFVIDDYIDRIEHSNSLMHSTFHKPNQFYLSTLASGHFTVYLSQSCSSILVFGQKIPCQLLKDGNSAIWVENIPAHAGSVVELVNNSNPQTLPSKCTQGIISGKFLSISYNGLGNEFVYSTDSNQIPFSIQLGIFPSINSSAYIFRPKEFQPFSFKPVIISECGPVLSRSTFTYTPWLSIILTVEHNSKSFQLDVITGPNVPVYGDLFLQFNFETDYFDNIFTDSAGYSLGKRFIPQNVEIYDLSRYIYPLVESALVSGPKISMAINSKKTQMFSAIRSQDTNSSQLLFGLFRKFQYPGQPNLGLDQALEDNSSTKSSLYFHIGTNFSSVNRQRQLVRYSLRNSPQFWDQFSVGRLLHSLPSVPYPLEISYIPFNTTGLGIRISHLFDFGEDIQFSKPIKVNPNIFQSLCKSIFPSTLDFNQLETSTKYTFSRSETQIPVPWTLSRPFWPNSNSPIIDGPFSLNPLDTKAYFCIHKND